MLFQILHDEIEDVGQIFCGKDKGEDRYRGSFKEDEAGAIVGYLDQIREGKKMAVSEAEKRAMFDMGNAKHFMENSNEAVQEMINAVKKRLDVLSFDYKNQGRIR